MRYVDSPVSPRLVVFHCMTKFGTALHIYSLPDTHRRYNSLLHAVARQLADLKKAVKGLVVVTPELEEISQALLQGKVRFGFRRLLLVRNLKGIDSRHT